MSIEQSSRSSSANMSSSGADLCYLTWRSVLIGGLCCSFLWAVTPYSDLFQMASLIASCHLPIGVLSLFFLLAFPINAALRAIRPSSALTAGELLVIYTMMLLASQLPSFGLAEHLLPPLVAPYYYATPANHWEEVFIPYLPTWWAPQDETVVREFFEGTRGGVPWGAWAKPLGFWATFVLPYYFVVLCLCTLLRRRWIEEEKLTFPLAQLPLEMADPHAPASHLGAFFRSRVMWIGLLLPAVLHSINSVHWYFPSFPYIRLKNIPLEPYLADTPLRWAGGLRAYFYPSVIGMTCLLTQEIGLSFWLFYVLYKLQLVLWHYIGAAAGGGASLSPSSFATSQEFGAFVAVAAYLVWSGRQSYGAFFREGLGLARPSARSAQGLVSARVACWGLLVGTAYLVVWWHFAGMSLMFSLSVIFFLYLILIVLTRVVSAGGILFVQKGYYPLDIYAAIAGQKAFVPKNLALLGMAETSFMCHLRGFLMPFVMDSSKIAEQARMSLRKLMPVYLSVLVIGAAASCASALRVIYTHGGVNLHPWFTRNLPMFHINKAVGHTTGAAGPNWIAIANMTFGAVVTLVMLGAQRRVTWWPIHPLGYTMATGWPMSQMWLSIFLGWVLKGLIVRYGGFKLYHRLRPFFLGMVLGEFVICGLWLLIDYSFGVTGHSIYPNET